MNDAGALARACALARRALGDVEPNPPVGAVVVQDGTVVGEGWHQHYGGPHAEVYALRSAGARARGGTLYVSLEPCSTAGKTPACTEQVLAAAPARVVVGAVDPNPAHAGRGLEQLRAAGIAVVCVDDPECVALVERFARTLDRELPVVFAKWAMSRDGAIAPAGGKSVKLSAPASDERVHQWRAHLDGILVGVGTVLADDPLLTARGALESVRPLHRVVLDPRLRTPLDARVVTRADQAPTWIVCTAAAAAAAGDAFTERGVRLLALGGAGSESAGDVVPPADFATEALRAVGRAGLGRIMVEGGARTLGWMFEASLVDQVAVLCCPVELGPGALPALPGYDLAGLAPEPLAGALGLVQWSVEASGPDTLLRGFCN